MRYYLIRHAEAHGQEPEAPLTARGEAQALALRDALLELGITAISSSPYRRALATVAPFAAAAGLPVRPDERLVEYRLAGAPRDTWREDLRLAFEDPDRALEGGETVRAARERALGVLVDGGAPGAGRVAICTHGALAAILIGARGPASCFEIWSGLRCPDLYELGVAPPRRLALPSPR